MAGIFYTGEHEKLYAEITPAVSCVAANPCANLKASVADLQSRISGLSVRDIWSDSAHDQFAKNKSAIVTKLGNMITSIGNAFEPSEQIYNNLKTELEILKDADDKYQQLLKNEPQQWQYTKKDSKGNDVPDTSAYHAAHAQWEQQKIALENFCKKCQDNIKNMEATLAAIDGTTVEGTLNSAFSIPGFTPKAWSDFVGTGTTTIDTSALDTTSGLVYGTNYYHNANGELCFDSLDTFQLYATINNLPSTNPDELDGTYNIAGYTEGFTYGNETTTTATTNQGLTFYRDADGNVVEVSGTIPPIDPNSQTLTQDVKDMYTAVTTYKEQITADIEALEKGREVFENSQLVSDLTEKEKTIIDQNIAAIDEQLSYRKSALAEIDKATNDGLIFDGNIKDAYDLALKDNPDTEKIINKSTKLNETIEKINGDISNFKPVYTMTEGDTAVGLIRDLDNETN